MFAYNFLQAFGFEVPWYAVVGETDYGFGNVVWPSPYTGAGDANVLWTITSSNYGKTFIIPGGGLLHIVFVDTSMLQPEVISRCAAGR